MNALINKLSSLVIFRNLLSDGVIQSMARMLEFEDATEQEIIYNYCEFAHKLFSSTTCISDYIRNAALDDENIYIKHKLQGAGDNVFFEQMLDRELNILKEVSLFDGKIIREKIVSVELPVWNVKDHDLKALYSERIANINTRGFGIYARHKMFVLDDKGRILPIKNPDRISLDDLIGYERERGIVLDNTLAFLNNKNANNVLLYGDAGTGKSSTVKALVNSLYDKGLRLIEFKKDQLEFIPRIIEELSDNPLKFIFFIDDLTFASDDNNFSALKATLEGGVCGRGHNILIYATSNHRHMIKESASARQDSVNVADALEESTSLSARFGITVTYLKCDRELFRRILTELALKNGISAPADELVVGGEAFALRGGGRNPRTAKQYIDMLGAKN